MTKAYQCSTMGSTNNMAFMSKPKSLVAYAIFFVAVGTLVALVRDTVVFVPLDLFMTAWHEAMHACAAWMTGGAVHEINVHAGHGTTLTSGGIFPLISMAGYMGTALWGCLLLATVRVEYARKPVQWITLSFPVVVMLLGGGVGINLVFVVLTVLILGYVWNRFGYWVGLALSVVFASESFRDVQVYLLQSPHETDAGILARYFGLPLLTLPIAFFLAVATFAVWCVVLKLILLNRQGKVNFEPTM